MSRRLVPWLSAALSAGLLILAFPPLGGWPLMWFALVPLWRAVLEAKTAKEAANWGGFCGLIFYSFSLRWLTKVFGPFAAAFWCIFALWLALHAGLLWTLGRRWAVKKPWAWVLAAGVLWVGMEYFRAEVWWLDNAFLVFGYSQVTHPPLLQSASLWGVYGLSGFIVAANAAWTLALRGKRGPAKAAFGTLAVLWVWGAWRVSRMSVDDGKALRIALVQDERYDLDNLAALSLSEPARGADLLVWPEYSFSIPIGQEEPYRKLLMRKLKGASGTAVIGAAVMPDEPKDKMRNFAWLIGSDGRELGRYDKLRPIPYVEKPKLAPNPDPRPVDTPQGRLGLQICYDLDFEQGARAMARRGAQILLVPNLDPYEWGEWEHRQHSAMAPVRAVETGLWIARAASSGISQLIDPAGRVRASLGYGETGVLAGEARLRSPGTVYSRVGWLLAPLCLVSSCLGLLRLRK